MIFIKKLLIFLCFFCAFNTLEVDSNSDKIIYYDSNNIYDAGFYTLYFDKLNSNKLNELINKYNIQVLSYLIDGEKYYARNIRELDDKFLIDKSLSEKIYYENNGYIIEGINVLCSIYDINNLKKETHIY